MKMMELQFFLLLLGLSVALTMAGEMDDFEARKMFQKFTSDYQKTYSTPSEYEKRLTVFAENLEKIRKHNSQKGRSWEMGVNKFSDLTDEEFRATYASGYVSGNVKRQNAAGGAFVKSQKRISSAYDLPASVDWRDEGVITAVKDQGSCGSCWAFAGVEQLESYLKLSGGDLEELSSQQITSCSPHTSDLGGCFGSFTQVGYTYGELAGVVREKDYPYLSGFTEETGKCKYNLESMEPVMYLRGYEVLPANEMLDIMDHLANVGPLSIAIDADKWSPYMGGVFDGCNYDDYININHAVQLVGYGTDEKEGDFWLVRNSWGENWGEDGYIRLKRESKVECDLSDYICGMCGVLLEASYPIGAEALDPSKR